MGLFGKSPQEKLLTHSDARVSALASELNRSGKLEKPIAKSLLKGLETHAKEPETLSTFVQIATPLARRGWLSEPDVQRVWDIAHRHYWIGGRGNGLGEHAREGLESPHLTQEGADWYLSALHHASREMATQRGGSLSGIHRMGKDDVIGGVEPVARGMNKSLTARKFSKAAAGFWMQSYLGRASPDHEVHFT